MTKRSYLYIPGLILCVLSAYLISFYNSRNQIYESYVTYVTGTGTYYVINREQVSKANAVLNRISYDDYGEMIKYYTEEIKKISILRNTILEDVEKTGTIYYNGVEYSEEELKEIADSYDMTAAQADETIGVYVTVNSRLIYAYEYENYLTYVYDNAEKMIGYRLFDDSTKNKIEEKRNDYSALSGIKINAYVTAGIEKFLDTPFDDILMLLGVLICAFSAYCSGVDYRKNSALIIKLILAICLLLITIAVATGINSNFTIGSLTMPVQSVPRFKTCSQKLSTGGLIVLRTLLKCMFYYMLFLLLLFFIKKKKILPVICTLTITVILEGAVLRGTVYDLFGILRLEKIMSYSNKEFFLYNVIFFSALMIGIVFLEFNLQKIRHAEEKKAEQQYLEDINEKYNEIRSLKHDMNNHLSAVLLMLNAGQNDEAKRYIEELTGVTTKVSDIKKTGIKALALLIRNKQSQSENEKTDLKISISDELDSSKISEYEICSLFANIIDNAIEAVRKLEEDKRWIRLNVRRQMDLICIFCENPYASVRKENNTFISTKKDSKNHGIGLKQVQHIAEKHGGAVEIDDKDEVFRISVIMNL